MVIIPTRAREMLGLCIEYIFVITGERFTLSFGMIESELLLSHVMRGQLNTTYLKGLSMVIVKLL